MTVPNTLCLDTLRLAPVSVSVILFSLVNWLKKKSIEQFFHLFFPFFSSTLFDRNMFLSTKERASKSLRRLTKTKISTPIAQVNTLELPKKIIKALYDYQAKAPHEISFKKGDFFHVTGRENDLDWFEACNPASNLKGIVPVSYFQVIDKTERSLAVNRPTSSSTSSTLTSELDSGFSDMSIHGKTVFFLSLAYTRVINHVLLIGSNLNNKKKQHQIYGVVMYDFKAERPDELDAQAGEAIVVIAQSNHEWFVAKPIGRLGGPGLIPVSFVQVRDAQTGELIDDRDQNATVHIPGVDDWKKMTQSYEASSIPLGVFEKKKSVVAAGTASRVSDASSASMAHDLVTFASIDSYILEGDQYWFVVYARVNQNCHRILYRLYEGKKKKNQNKNSSIVYLLL
jgi:bud emergence protein 1